MVLPPRRFMAAFPGAHRVGRELFVFVLQAKNGFNVFTFALLALMEVNSSHRPSARMGNPDLLPNLLMPQWDPPPQNPIDWIDKSIENWQLWLNGAYFLDICVGVCISVCHSIHPISGPPVYILYILISYIYIYCILYIVFCILSVRLSVSCIFLYWISVHYEALEFRELDIGLYIYIGYGPVAGWFFYFGLAAYVPALGLLLLRLLLWLLLLFVFRSVPFVQCINETHARYPPTEAAGIRPGRLAGWNVRGLIYPGQLRALRVWPQSIDCRHRHRHHSHSPSTWPITRRPSPVAHRPSSISAPVVCNCRSGRAYTQKLIFFCLKSTHSEKTIIFHL